MKTSNNGEALPPEPEIITGSFRLTQTFENEVSMEGKNEVINIPAVMIPTCSETEWIHRYRRRIAIRTVCMTTRQDSMAEWMINIRAFMMRFSIFWPPFVREYPLPDPLDLTEDPENWADEEIDCWSDDGEA